MLKTLSHLFRQASLQASPDEAVALVLEWVLDRLQVHVCALYARSPETDVLRPLALRGAEGQHDPPPSLAGVVAEGFEPVRLREPWRHPCYGPEAGAEQRRFHAYLGVPIIRLRKVLGVLEVQRTDDRQFEKDDAALLLTVALQLTGMIQGAEPKSTSRRGRQEMYTGTPAAPGVAVGRIYAPAVDAVLDAVPDRVAVNVDTEIRDFQDAVSAVQAELRGSGQGVGAQVLEDLTALYQAYEMILEDPHLVDGVMTRIRSGQWAPAAVRDATRELVSRFEAMDDAYLRARAEDIRSVGRRILYHLQSHANILADFPERTVLLGQSMGLTCITGVPADRLAGLVCTGGSLLSHGVIVARALGIPAVIGAAGLIPSPCAGREIILDGYRGRVILDPTPEVRAEFQRFQQQASQLRKGLDELRDLPAVTPDGRHIALQANITLLDEIRTAKEQGAAGVGLYRSEFPFLLRDTLPGEDTQYAIYRELLAAFHPLPVTIRTLDAGGDKVLPYLRFAEDNPALGQRGIRLCLEHPEIFLTQLRALLRANAGLGNLRLLLPMLTLTSELQEARVLIERTRTGLEEEGQPASLPPVGIMVEVPAAVFRIDALAAEADFVSIGTNDLTQYLLATDRANPYVGKMCDPLTPAVLDAIGMVAEGARRWGRPVSVGGELAGDPFGALLLLGLGVDALSMTPGSIGRVKQVIRSFSASQAGDLWRHALQEDSADGVREMLVQALEDKGIGGLVRPGR
jgi:phosphotransferase system enzyme I (PtsP)